MTARQRWEQQLILAYVRTTLFHPTSSAISDATGIRPSKLKTVLPEMIEMKMLKRTGHTKNGGYCLPNIEIQNKCVSNRRPLCDLEALKGEG